MGDWPNPYAVTPRKDVLRSLLERVEAWTPKDWPHDRDHAIEDDVMAATLEHCKEQSCAGFKMYWVGDGTTNSLSLTTSFEGVVRLMDERFPCDPIALRRERNGKWAATVCAETAEHASPHLALLAATLKALIADGGNG